MRNSLALAAVISVLVGAAPVSAEDAFWTGFYAGGNVGYGWTGVKTTDGFLETPGTVFGIAPVFPAQRYAAANSKGTLDGAFGGGQLGYNAEFGAFVIGAEADIQAGDMEQSTSFIGSDLGPTYRTSSELNYFGTVRARLGVVTNGVLLYGTAGLAFGQGEGAVSITPGTPDSPGVGGPYAGKDKQSYLGYAVGGGVEVPLSEMLSLKVEYLHVDLGSETYRFNLADSDGSFVQTKEAVTLDTVRGGLNVHF
jgi:outer membrane immunogenic protein